MPSRKPNKRLDQADIARLVAMRDEERASWMQIGRVFGKQDSVCSRIYDRAKAGVLASATPADKTERQAAALSPGARRAMHKSIGGTCG
jgi:hypothetical protein